MGAEKRGGYKRRREEGGAKPGPTSGGAGMQGQTMMVAVMGALVMVGAMVPANEVMEPEAGEGRGRSSEKEEQNDVVQLHLDVPDMEEKDLIKIIRTDLEKFLLQRLAREPMIIPMIIPFFIRTISDYIPRYIWIC